MAHILDGLNRRLRLATVRGEGEGIRGLHCAHLEPELRRLAHV